MVLGILLFRVIQTFSWEQKEKLRQLQKDALASEERRRLGMELHDNVLQRLYSTGLKVEYLLKKEDCGNLTNGLNEIKGDLTSTISTVRKFLATSTSEIIKIGMMQERLVRLVGELNRNHEAAYELHFETPAFRLANLSLEKSTEIFYIIQESLLNASKHAKADLVKVLIGENSKNITVTIQDNGVGLRESKKHLGIQSMEERAKKVKGQLTIEEGKKGTIVKLIVPWEEK